MKYLEGELKRVYEKYLRIRRKLEEIDLSDYQGHLDIKCRNGNLYYYQVIKDHVNKKYKQVYIKKKDFELAKALAQKSYNNKVKRLLDKRISQIERLFREYRNNELEELFLGMSSEKQDLIVPLVLTADQSKEQWLKRTYKSKAFYPGDPVIFTNKGERVRSKSEKILADKFYELKIPYKYECPLDLADGRRFYPDFTFYNPVTNKEIYWEHFGMMDLPAYAEKAVRKINEYGRNGIIFGRNLLASFEFSKEPLNFDYINILIKNHLNFY